MGELEQMFAAFDALGEAEVTRRVEHNTYPDDQRAYALRWLAERGLARAEAEAALIDAGEREQRLTRRRVRRETGYAVALAAVSAFLVVAAAFEVLHSSHSAPAGQVAGAASSAPTAAVMIPVHRRHPGAV
jgi:hypothetical protein